MKIKANRKVVKADFDAEAFKARHKAAQERKAAKAQDKANKAESIAFEIREAEDPIETAFELLVPASGKADTVAGEMVRAMMRILYRDYNDGDVFYNGYGIETCGDAVAYLCDKMPELEQKFEDIAMRNFEGDSYTEAIKEISDDVIDQIISYPELITQKNTEDMFDFDGEQFINDHDWVPEYEYDIELPYHVQLHIENGNINESDVKYEVEGWMDHYNSKAEIEVRNDYVYFSGLNVEEYTELEDNGYRWMEDYESALDDEYGDPEEEEYEEDEE